MAFELMVDYTELSLSSVDYFKEMGYPDRRVPDIVRQIVEEMTEIIRNEVKSSFAFSILEGEVVSTQVILNEYGLLEIGEVLGHLMQNSERIAVFTATAGTTYQSLLDEVKKKDDLLHWFILDSMGSCIVERTGDIMERYLEQHIPEYRHTARFSPGYCGWKLTEQRKIFQILGNNVCGISLSESCLMYPIKSISGIVGIGKNVCEKKYGCSICKQNNCYKRRKNKTHEKY